MNLSVPIKLLKEFKDRKVTVEVSGGEAYKGIVCDIEENLSISLDNVKATLADGKEVKMEGVYIKGSRVRLISLPSSAADCLPKLTRPPAREGRAGFRGGPKRGGRPSFGRR